MTSAAACSLTLGSAGEVSWKVATRTVSRELAGYVRGLYGYVESSLATVRRREVPALQVVVIFQLGEPIRVFEPGQAEHWQRHPGGFVAGLDDRFTLTEYQGAQRGVQLNLTPLGARLLFGIPMSELARQVIPVSDVLPEGRRFGEQLGNCATWEARFDQVEALLRRRLLAVPARSQIVGWAYDQIVAKGFAAREN
jgi:hypothetical protein